MTALQSRLAESAYTSPITYEVRNLNVTTDGDLAFVHSVNHVKGTLASGRVSDLWLRWTAWLEAPMMGTPSVTAIFIAS